MICDEHRAPDSTRPCDPPPTGSSVSLETRTPYVVDYPGEDGGKTTYCTFRWVATTGEKRPWSKTAGATIGA